MLHVYTCNIVLHTHVLDARLHKLLISSCDNIATLDCPPPLPLPSPPQSNSCNNKDRYSFKFRHPRATCMVLSFKFLTLLLCSHCYTYNASTFNCKHTVYVCMMPNKHGPKVSNVVVHSTCCPDILIIQNYASIMGSRNNPNPHLHPTWECGISSRLQSQMRRAGRQDNTVEIYFLAP